MRSGFRLGHRQGAAASPVKRLKFTQSMLLTCCLDKVASLSPQCFSGWMTSTSENHQEATGTSPGKGNSEWGSVFWTLFWCGVRGGQSKQLPAVGFQASAFPSKPSLPELWELLAAWNSLGFTTSALFILDKRILNSSFLAYLVCGFAMRNCSTPLLSWEILLWEGGTKGGEAWVLWGARLLHILCVWTFLSQWRSRLLSVCVWMLPTCLYLSYTRSTVSSWSQMLGQETRTEVRDEVQNFVLSWPVLCPWCSGISEAEESLWANAQKFSTAPDGILSLRHCWERCNNPASLPRAAWAHSVSGWGKGRKEKGKERRPVSVHRGPSEPEDVVWDVAEKRFVYVWKNIFRWGFCVMKGRFFLPIKG